MNPRDTGANMNRRRMLIAEEVNYVETAYLRLQLVPHETQLALQGLFRRYVAHDLTLT